MAGEGGGPHMHFVDLLRLPCRRRSEQGELSQWRSTAVTGNMSPPSLLQLPVLPPLPSNHIQITGLPKSKGMEESREGEEGCPEIFCNGRCRAIVMCCAKISVAALHIPPLPFCAIFSPNSHMYSSWSPIAQQPQRHETGRNDQKEVSSGLRVTIPALSSPTDTPTRFDF